MMSAAGKLLCASHVLPSKAVCRMSDPLQCPAHKQGAFTSLPIMMSAAEKVSFHQPRLASKHVLQHAVPLQRPCWRTRVFFKQRPAG